MHGDGPLQGRRALRGFHRHLRGKLGPECQLCDAGWVFLREICPRFGFERRSQEEKKPPFSGTPKSFGARGSPHGCCDSDFKVIGGHEFPNSDVHQEVPKYSHPCNNENTRKERFCTIRSVGSLAALAAQGFFVGMTSRRHKPVPNVHGIRTPKVLVLVSLVSLQANLQWVLSKTHPMNL